MKFIDISRPVHKGMAIYPGNPEVGLEQVVKAGAETSALTKITLGSHTGTHIDAPSHIVEGGRGAGVYNLEKMVGKEEVVDINDQLPMANDQPVNTITASDLPAITSERVLIKTKNSSGDIDVFDPEFVALDETAAQKLVDQKMKLVGIDGPSIKKKGVRDRVHAILLDAGVVILEGLWLANVDPGNYELICLPLPVDSDGAPVRAVLRELHGMNGSEDR